MKKILISAAVLLVLGASQRSEAQGKSGSQKKSHQTVTYKDHNPGYRTDDDVIVTEKRTTYRSNKAYQPRTHSKQYRATRHDNGLHKGWYKGKHKGWYKKSRRPVKH